MKRNIKFFGLLILLSLVLATNVAHTTDVARFPLKSSLLAKPNVILGLDDSGSMTSEVLFNTSDGAFWWDYFSNKGWAADGKLLFNDTAEISKQWRKYPYIFPTAWNTNDKAFVIPPTSAFAFMRSPDYNTMYYNPSITYLPWTPAYIDGSTVTFADATPTSAKVHPLYDLGAYDLTHTQPLSTADGKVFTVLPGMSLPAGAKKKICNEETIPSGCGNWITVGTNEVAPNNHVTYLAMAYFPATYYLKESCSTNGTSCVRAPDGATLQRYEIKPGNFSTAVAYDAAIQNFANWFQYYRVRTLMLNSAIGQSLESLTGLRIGVVPFSELPSDSTRIRMYDTDDDNPANNALKVTGIIYKTFPDVGGTPTRQTLNRIGQEYKNTSGPIQYACQRSNAFILTDGYANTASVTKPSYDKNIWGAVAPYATTYDDSLADIALSYYTTNLRPDLPLGRVAETAIDHNTKLHMNTYGLTLGAKGFLFLGDNSTLPTDIDAWPDPTASRDPSAVDDLWHATLNGRGNMYFADAPTETATKIQAGLKAILGAGAQGGVGVSSVNLARSDAKAYFASYDAANWTGDLVAKSINIATGKVSSATPLWSAATKLNTRTTSRVIASSTNGTNGVRFTASAVGSLVNPSNKYGASEDVIDYLRGNRSKEGNGFRVRTSLLGAVINSEPFVSREYKVAYVQSGEGMLHAFDTENGEELWAFVPHSVLSTIGQTVKPNYSFVTKLDGTAVVANISNTPGTPEKLLVASTGVTGRSFYALNVTDPRTLTDESTLADRVKWEFPVTNVHRVGLAVGRPLIVHTKTDGAVVLLTSGYNNKADGQGRLWMLEAGSGDVLKEFTVSGGSLTNESGLAQVSALAEYDGTVRYVYGGDLLGNVWRFDLENKTIKKLAVLKDAAGNLQPVTAAPEMFLKNGKRIIVIGTGRMLDITDFGSSKTQTIYAIADGPTLSNPRGVLKQQTYDAGDNSVAGDITDWNTQRGWYFDLPAGEQVNTRPSLAFGALAFVANKNDGTACTESSSMYVLNVLTGQAFEGTPVAVVISESSTSSGVTVLLTDDGNIVGVGQNSNGDPWQHDIASTIPVIPTKNAWREIRRQ